MAKFDLINREFKPDEYVVQRDDGSCYERFNDYSEARNYYNYLQQLDDQKRSVEQNDEIIANQKRLLEMQAQNNRMPQRPLFPQPTRQILDPAYQEWLRFMKDTDPKFKEWKRKQEAEEARKREEKERARREEAARAAKLQAEKEERERERQKQLQLEKERKLREIQEEIRSAEEDLINGKPVNNLVKIAKYTKNQQVIDICKESSRKEILSALSRNPSVNEADNSLINNKLAIIRQNELKKRKEDAERKREIEEEQARKRGEDAEREENFKTALKWILGIAVVGLIIYFAKWIFAVIFVIALIVIFFSN